MATRDGFSDKRVEAALASTAIGSDTTTVGNIIDTADYDMGVAFFVDVSAYTDGTYTLLFEDGDDSGLSDAATVPDEKIIGQAVSLTAATAGAFAGNGLFSTRRYVRLSVVSTGVSTGATLSATVVMQGEYNPQEGLV